MAEPAPATVSKHFPAASLPADQAPRIEALAAWPAPIDREWAWGGSTGAGTRVCILDSGVDAEHPLVGGLERSVTVSARKGAEPVIADEPHAGDDCGHGTACAGIVRSIAPDASIASVKVLGSGYRGSGRVLLAGLRWALNENYDVINLSLSTTRRRLAAILRELSDAAYFRRRILVASAHNLTARSYPWRFPSVISVGSHDGDDPLQFFYNPRPPVEFFARGVNVPVAWSGGATLSSTGNSFATPHITAICALILAKHPELTPFQLKSVLHDTASNVVGDAR